MSAYVAGRLLVCEAYASSPHYSQLLDNLLELISGNNGNDVRRAALSVIKRIAKRHHAVIAGHMDRVVSTVLGCVRDRNIPVKLTSERALLYTLQLQHDDTGFEAYNATGNAANVKALGDFYRRVLSKLAANVREGQQSEDEEEDGLLRHDTTFEDVSA
jgi:hypothetical protein